MAVATPAKTAALLELRSAALTLVAVVLKTTDLAVLAQELAERVAITPDLFDNDAVAVDLWRVREEGAPIDFGALINVLRSHRLVPVAVRGGSPAQMAAAAAAGLAEAPDMPRPNASRDSEPVVLTECVREVQLPAPPVLIVDKPLRSGQQVYARGGDLVVLSLVSFGAEVIADGNIHVYAPLRGRAHRRRQGRHRGAHLHHLHAGAAAFDRRRLPHRRDGSCPPTCWRAAGAGATGRRQPAGRGPVGLSGRRPAEPLHFH